MIRVDAIYARQSADRADSISIETQIKFCEFETHGEPHRVFWDKGCSGKNTDRPEFQKMMDAVRRGEIKRVLCYKLDRCSRSVIDFVRMMEELQEYDVEFLSCTEQFDTSTPMGRAMLNICIVFAQLERETIQMRVEDAFRSMSQKGFHMGTPAPYGFTREPCLLNGKKTANLVVTKEECYVIRLIYDLYQDSKTRTCDVIQVLMYCGIPNPHSKDGTWSGGTILRLVSNPAYVRADKSVYLFFKENGAMIHNAPEDFIGINGCYLYQDRSKGRGRFHIEGCHLVLAPHEGIIPSDLWLRCRKKIKYDGKTKDNSVKVNWLSGKVKCGNCGYALKAQSTPGSPARTYVCSKSVITQKTCEGVGKIPAGQIEAVVLDEMKQVIRTFASILPPSAKKTDPRIWELNNRISLLQGDIDLLKSRLLEANSVLASHIGERISKLERKKDGLQAELHRIQSTLDGKVQAPNAPANDLSKWDQLTISDKLTVVDALIEVIHVTQSDVMITWKI